MGCIEVQVRELMEDLSVIEWLDVVEAKPNTARNYPLSMKYFTEYTGKSPTEILNEAYEEIRIGKHPGERRIKRDLAGFKKYLKDERNVAPSTVNINMHGISSFFTSHDIKIPRSGKNKDSSPLIENLKIPSRKDLQEAINVCDPLEKAILLTGIASGLSMYEIRHLRIHHVNKISTPQQTSQN